MSSYLPAAPTLLPDCQLMDENVVLSPCGKDGDATVLGVERGREHRQPGHLQAVPIYRKRDETVGSTQGRGSLTQQGFLFLFSGGAYYVPYIFCFISNKFCNWGEGRGGGST
jgi:hypothetical protein